MTEAQAHEFIARWSRRMITWRARNEAGRLRDLERSFTGLMAGGFLITIIVFPHTRESFWQTPAVIWGLFQFSFSFVMVLKLRQARHALDKSQIVNHKS
jgi:hypothetical protein